MVIKVVIDLKNPNALIAMAQVSQNANNPYAIFCEYIKYCIFSNAHDTMTLSEIRIAIGEEFGLHLPYNIVSTCLKHIQNEKVICQDDFQIKRIGTFDIENFDRERASYRAIELTLIDALIKYVAKFNRVWEIEYAREQLIKVLDRNGLAYEIFIHKQLKQSDELISDANMRR